MPLFHSMPVAARIPKLAWRVKRGFHSIPRYCGTAGVAQQPTNLNSLSLSTNGTTTSQNDVAR